MPQKLPINNFEWIEETYQFNEDFKNCNEESDEGYFLEVDVQHPQKNFIMIYHFYIKELRLKK